MGRETGLCFIRRDFFPAVFFRGELGAGKTTMIRGIVSALPGGEEAEVSSPSFNLVNIYPTRPETVHVDLYRLQGADPDEDVVEMLTGQDRLVLVEWSEYLQSCHLPEDRVEISIELDNDSRKAQIAFYGEASIRMITAHCFPKKR